MVESSDLDLQLYVLVPWMKRRGVNWDGGLVELGETSGQTKETQTCSEEDVAQPGCDPCP